MTDATMEAVAKAICNNFPKSHYGCAVRCMDRLGSIPKTGCRYAKDVHEKMAQAAIDAMPSQECQPIEISDVVRTGLRMSVRLEVGDELGMLRVTYDGEGFRLDFSPEQLRDIYNAVGETLPAPPEKV